MKQGTLLLSAYNKNEMEDMVEMVERCPVNAIVFYRTVEEEII